MAWHGNPDPSGVRSILRTGEVAWPLGDPRAARLEWTDEALMLAISSRDECAFAVLYDRYVDLVYSASLRVLANPQLAEDITQDVFVRLWRRPESFIAARGRFLTWLMSVTRNRAIDEVRALGRRRQRELSQPEDSEADPRLQIAASGDDPLVETELHELRRLVHSVVSELPREQRRALEFAYFGGLTQREISELSHEPLGTIKTRIRLGMQKLRRALQDRV